MSRTVQNLVDEVQADVVTDLSDANMLGYVKSGLRFLNGHIRSRLFVTEDTATLTQNTDSVDLTDLSPAFVRPREVWYLDSGNERIPILKPPSIREFHVSKQNGVVGKPLYYLIERQTMEFDKNADSNITIGFDYFVELTESIALGDTFIGDEIMFEAAKCYTKAEYYLQYEEDDKKAAIYESKGDRLANRMAYDYEAEHLGGHVEETEEY